MSHYTHQEPPAPPMTPYPPPVSAPPPMGYPIQYGPAGYPQQGVPHETTTTFGGNGFWKGCCAGFCCCSRIYSWVSACFTADCFTAGF